MGLRKHYLKTAQSFINDEMKQEEERRLKLLSQIEDSRPKFQRDPWAYDDESDDEDVVVQKEIRNIEMVEALRESNTT